MLQCYWRKFPWPHVIHSKLLRCINISVNNAKFEAVLRALLTAPRRKAEGCFFGSFLRLSQAHHTVMIFRCSPFKHRIQCLLNHPIIQSSAFFSARSNCLCRYMVRSLHLFVGRGSSTPSVFDTTPGQSVTCIIRAYSYYFYSLRKAKI